MDHLVTAAINCRHTARHSALVACCPPLMLETLSMNRGGEQVTRHHICLESKGEGMQTKQAGRRQLASPRHVCGSKCPSLPPLACLCSVWVSQCHFSLCCWCCGHDNHERVARKPESKCLSFSRITIPG